LKKAYQHKVSFDSTSCRGQDNSDETLSTDEQTTDIFTKALGREKFEKFRKMLGLTKSPSD